VDVAGASVFRPVFSGLIQTLFAVALLACGGVMLYIGLTEDQTVLLGLGAPFTLVGLLFAAKAVRRFRAAGDKRIYLRAGPDGVVIGMPSSKISNMVRLGYRFVVHEMKWNEIRTWYPHVIRVNGIPTDRSLVFEGTEGWKLSVPLLFFGGSQRQITDDLQRAINRTDLREATPPA
jgi:hypothetical protein